MIGFLRLFVILFVVLSLIHIGLSWQLRRAEAARLAQEWDSDGHSGPQEDYVAAGMARYAQSLRRKLLWGVYVIPICVIACIIWVTNTV